VSVANCCVLFLLILDPPLDNVQQLINIDVTVELESIMTSVDPRKWLLLIHQIPPKPNALRVKIWRRLQQVGAVAIKQSVYAMPFSEQSREDLSWMLKEIVEGGGDGSISEARFVEGLTDEQVVALFQNDPQDPAVRGPAQVSRLQRRLDEVGAIDFFQSSERGTAEILIKELAARLSGQASAATAVQDGSAI